VFHSINKHTAAESVENGATATARFYNN